LFPHLKCLEERGVVTDVCQLSDPCTGVIQVTFRKSSDKSHDNKVDIDDAVAAFATRISTETNRDTVQIGEGKVLNVYITEGKKTTTKYSGVYGLIHLLMVAI
jgi:hypothetical protein